MKTIQDLLNFYEVEFGKTYKITKQAINSPGFWIDSTFAIVEENNKLIVIDIVDRNTITHRRNIYALNEFEYEEVKPEILTEKEKDYLLSVIAPFKERVASITKCKSITEENEYINMKLIKDDNCVLPYFNINTMYKGMIADRAYTLKELNL